MIGSRASIPSSQLLFQLLNRRQLALQFLRQGFRELVPGNSDGLPGVPQGVFHDHLVFCLAENNTDASI